jgi:hypothetical protein
MLQSTCRPHSGRHVRRLVFALTTVLGGAIAAGSLDAVRTQAMEAGCGRAGSNPIACDSRQPGDSFEPNGTPESAVTIGALPYDSKISTELDLDWYRFSVTGAGTVNIQLTVPASMDLRFDLFSETGVLLSTSVEDVHGNEALDREVSAASRYLLRVGSSGRWSRSDTYRLTLSGSVVANPAIPNVLLGLGPHADSGGWFAIHGGGETAFAPHGWGRLPWAAYNAAGGGVRLAAGDVDGDGADEVIVGLGRGGGGFVAVLDDAAHAYALLTWLRVDWPTYNAANGETFPAAGDLDGDGRAEIVLGLGDGGRGWYEIFDDASQRFRHLAWKRVSWPTYNAGSGPTHPAIGDVDGDGAAEIVLGLGKGSDGWLQVVDDRLSAFAHSAWIRIDWPTYTAVNGTTFPALGDLDDDGRTELVVGLGRGSNGWFGILDDQSAGLEFLGWDRIDSPGYNAYSGETHPAAGNLDGDPAAEIVMGLAEHPGGGGRFEIRDYIGGQVFSGWFEVAWPAFRSSGGALFPAVAARR